MVDSDRGMTCASAWRLAEQQTDTGERRLAMATSTLDHNQTFSDADGDRLGATGGAELDEN